MTTEINIRTATEWLENRYKDVLGVWAEFDKDCAVADLINAMYKYSIEMCGHTPAVFSYDEYGLRRCKVCGHGCSTPNHWLKGDYNDLPTLDLMCIMADARM